MLLAIPCHRLFLILFLLLVIQAILHQFTKAEAGRKLLSDARFRKRYIGRGEPSDEKYKI